MRKAVYVFFVFCLLFLFSCKKSVQKPEFPVNRDTFSTKVDELLTNSKFTGVVLVALGDEIVFTKGYGHSDPADGTSPLPDENDIFETGSITKQLTASAIMQLVEKKKIKLDDPVTKYLPELTNFLGDENAPALVTASPSPTIENLLSMRAGFSDHINMPDDFFTASQNRWLDKFYHQKNSLPPDTMEKAGLTKEFMLDAINKSETVSKPGKTFFYSNTSYYLLALIIEKVSGLSYDDYITKNILQKLGMNHSNLENWNTTTKGYFKKEQLSIPKPLLLGCGDLNSSALDLLKWNQAFTHGKVVNASSFDRMIQTESYGFGIYFRPEERQIFHGGATCCFNSYNTYFLDKDISIILLCNAPSSSVNASFLGNTICTYISN